MAYRDATERKTVIHHRAMQPLAAIALGGIIVAMAVFSLFQAFTFARSVRFECVKGGEHTCVVLRDYGVVTTRQALPIQYIGGVRVTSHSAKGGTKYGVSIDMRDGESVALMRPSSKGTAELVRSGVELVLSGDRGTSGMPVEERAPLMAVFLALVGVGFGAMVLVFTRSARLEFDLDRAKIHYTLNRWPLRPTRRTFELDAVTDARMLTRVGSKNRRTYETALGVRGEGDFVLVSGGGGSEAHNKAAVASINAVLERMRGAAGEA